MTAYDEVFTNAVVSLERCINPSELLTALKIASEILDCAMAVFIKGYGWIGGSNIDPEDFRTEMADKAHHDNLWRDRMQQMRLSVARFSDCPPREDLLRSNVYGHWLKPRNWVYGAILAALNGPDYLAWIAFFRTAKKGDFTDEEMDLITRLQPHFEATIQRIMRVDELLRFETIPDKAVERFQLTKQETKVLLGVLKGKTNQEIAEELFIAEGTVKLHIVHIFKKTGTHHRSELAIWLFQNLLSPDG
ncbi:MAG: response regulator transcription factor [Armatimonadetes bacterium]|nr:response regulator transcription factor [Armatimonadota bacterium]